MAAATELVGERGLDGFTMREVSARAGSSPSLAGHYFPTKALLLNAVAKDLLPPPSTPKQPETLGFTELLSAMRDALAAELEDPITARARLIFLTAIHTASRFEGVITAYYRDRVARIVSHLEAGQAAGEIRSVDCGAQALVMLATHRAMVLLALSAGLEIDLARLADTYVEAVRRSLAGEMPSPEEGPSDEGPSRAEATLAVATAALRRGLDGE